MTTHVSLETAPRTLGPHPRALVASPSTPRARAAHPRLPCVDSAQVLLAPLHPLLPRLAHARPQEAPLCWREWATVVDPLSSRQHPRVLHPRLGRTPWTSWHLFLGTPISRQLVALTYLPLARRPAASVSTTPGPVADTPGPVADTPPRSGSLIGVGGAPPAGSPASSVSPSSLTSGGSAASLLSGAGSSSGGLSGLTTLALSPEGLLYQDEYLQIGATSMLSFSCSFFFVTRLFFVQVSRASFLRAWVESCSTTGI